MLCLHLSLHLSNFGLKLFFEFRHLLLHVVLQGHNLLLNCALQLLNYAVLFNILTLVWESVDINVLIVLVFLQSDNEYIELFHHFKLVLGFEESSLQNGITINL